MPCLVVWLYGCPVWIGCWLCGALPVPSLPPRCALISMSWLRFTCLQVLRRMCFSGCAPAAVPPRLCLLALLWCRWTVCSDEETEDGGALLYLPISPEVEEPEEGGGSVGWQADAFAVSDVVVWWWQPVLAALDVLCCVPCVWWSCAMMLFDHFHLLVIWYRLIYISYTCIYDYVLHVHIYVIYVCVWCMQTCSTWSYVYCWFCSFNLHFRELSIIFF